MIKTEDHPANVFVRAFLNAQVQTNRRSRDAFWRLSEFWTDNVKQQMNVCLKFINPILEEALAKKKLLKENGLLPEEKPGQEREVMDGETLLDHLVNCTEGTSINLITSMF